MIISILISSVDTGEVNHKNHLLQLEGCCLFVTAVWMLFGFCCCFFFVTFEIFLLVVFQFVWGFLFVSKHKAFCYREHHRNTYRCKISSLQYIYSYIDYQYSSVVQFPFSSTCFQKKTNTTLGTSFPFSVRPLSEGPSFPTVWLSGISLFLPLIYHLVYSHLNSSTSFIQSSTLLPYCLPIKLLWNLNAILNQNCYAHIA